MRRLKLLAVFALLAVLVASAGCAQREAPNTPQEQREMKQEQKQPGEEKPPEPKSTQLIEDQAPQGCASCHKKTDDKDYRLSAEVKGIANHPSVPENATVKDCVTCHAKGSARPLDTILHRVHLVEGKHYTDRYGKNCLNCHKVLDNGKIRVKGLEQG